MAIVTDTHITPEAAGNREQLADFVSNIAPKETPFMSGIAGKGPPARGTFVEWMQDDLAAASENAVVQGNNTTVAAVVPRTRTGNYTQISSKNFMISRTQNQVEKAGVPGTEAAFQKIKLMTELKRDMEFGFCHNHGAVPAAEATPPKSAGIPAWIKTNTVFESAGSDPVYVGNIPTDPRNAGTPDAFVEADLQEAMRESWSSGGNPSIALMGPTQKLVFSTFTGIAANRHQVTGTSMAIVTGAVEIYVSDFGNLTAVPTRFMAPIDCFILDPEFWKIRYLHEPAWTPLAKTGDADRELLNTEYVLQAKNEASSAIITDLS